MSNHFRNHDHTSRRDLRRSSKQTYAAVVGTVEIASEKGITGRSGDHLQFYVDVGGATRYQVDINTQSSDGTLVHTYIADESIATDPNEPPFGFPSYGVYPGPEAKLSYAGLGLSDAEFEAQSDTRIESQLEAALAQCEFVALYGFVFDDGGANGKGIHRTHLNPGGHDQDGAVVVYIAPSEAGQPGTRRWFFFKFQNETIPPPR